MALYEKLTALSVKLQQTAAGVLGCTPPDELVALLSHGVAADQGRTVLGLAVELECKLFLAAPEAQLVLNRIWTGRVAEPNDDDSEVAVSTRHAAADVNGKAGAAAQSHTSLLQRLVAARRANAHSTFWSLLWPLLAVCCMPLLSLVPPQLMHESFCKPLFTPCERYWTQQASYVCFVILLMHLSTCDMGPGCGVRLELDIVLGLWLVALLGAEGQAAWHVARVQVALGRPMREALHHLHVTNAWKRIDLLGVLVALAAAGLRLHSRTRHAVPEADVRAVASLLLWSRLLSMLSMHVTTGPLLASIRRMVVYDVGRYCIVQVLTIVTFAAAFVCLYNGEETDAGVFLGTPRAALTTLCELTLLIGEPHGGSLWDMVTRSEHPALGWVITATFSVASVLLLINLLIGMLDNSYDVIRSTAQLEYAHGRSREVLGAAVLPLVPPPLNLVQAPVALAYNLVTWLSRHAAPESRHSTQRIRRASFSVGGGGPMEAWASKPRAQRVTIFRQAWEDVGWQVDPADGVEAWRTHVSRSLAEAARQRHAVADVLTRLQLRMDEHEKLLRAATASAPEVSDNAPEAPPDEDTSLMCIAHEEGGS